VTHQCFVCSRTLRPADEPSLLWPVRQDAAERKSFHLSCWLAFRAQHRDAQAAFEATPEHLAAA